MEAICSSETSVDFQRTVRRYIQEDSTPEPQAYPTSLCSGRAEMHPNINTLKTEFLLNNI
jgi:hypothetical protein